MERIIKIFSSTVLSVYITYFHLLIMEYLIKDFVINLVHNDIIILIIIVLFIALFGIDLFVCF